MKPGARSTPSWLPLLIGACLLPSVARADGEAERMRAALAQHQAAVVEVRATIYMNVEGLPGLGKGARRTYEVSVGGVVVSDDGLVLAPASGLDPAARAYALLGGRTSPQVSQVQVVGSDGAIRAAAWLGSDPESGLALIRVPEAGRKGLKPPAWKADAKPAPGDPLLVLSLTPEPLGTHPRVEATRVSFAGDGRLGISPQLPQSMGGLVVTPAGTALGVLAPLPVRPERGDVLRPDRLAMARSGFVTLAAGFADLVANPPKDVPQSSGARGRAWLGIDHQVVTPELAERLGLDLDVGVRIARVFDGPAKAAGLQEGDVFVQMDGMPLDLDPGESFDQLVADYGVGEVVPFVVRRGGKVKSVELTLARGPVRPEDAERASMPEVGLLVRALTFLDRAQAGIEGKAPGAVVLEVTPDGAASRAGVRPGDLIVGVEGAPPPSLAELRRRLLAPGSHPLTIRRRGEELTLRVRR
jgi:serine protease Do